MDFLNVLFAIFAVYRLATDVAWEDGPLDAYTHLRTLATRAGDDSWIARGMACPICLSFWLALPAALWLVGFSPLVLVWWLGIAGIAAWLARMQ